MLRYFLLFLSTLMLSPTIASASDSSPIAYSMRVIGDSSRFRLLIDFDTSVFHNVYLLDSPKRLVLDFPLTYFAFGDALPATGTTLVEKVRYGEVGTTGSRVVLDLSGPIEIASVETKSISSIDGSVGSHHRLILDGVATSATQFSSTVVSSDLSIPEISDRDYTVVIDPGHGGADGGAVADSPHTIEKTITLGFSKILRDKLSIHPSIRVILTHEQDRFMTLDERRDVVRLHSADLFISIHADSFPKPHLRGATFYTLSSKGSDELSRSLAAEHNRSDSLSDLSLESEQIDAPVSDILIDLARQETELYSLEFTDLAISHFRFGGINLINSPRRNGNFAVLRNPYTPSVLVELGYLSNPQDTIMMRQIAWQEGAATLLAGSILEFFESRKSSGILR